MTLDRTSVIAVALGGSNIRIEAMFSKSHSRFLANRGEAQP